MSEVVISADKRENKGKSFARRIRNSGKVPGVLYGAGDPVTIAMDYIELSRLLRKSHAIINVKVDGEDQQAVVKEVQHHPVSGKIIHIDFMRVVAGQEITITVPIHLLGTAIGTKTGGILSTLKNELEISVLPKYMPDNVEVDISELEIGDAFRVKDLNLENMTILDDEDDMICHVTLPRQVEEEEEVEEELGLEEEEDAEPEVITSRGDSEEKEPE
jgi:large subunit ribosomal protein L25